MQHHRQLLSTLDLLLLSPELELEELNDSLTFVAGASQHFPTEKTALAEKLLEMLSVDAFVDATSNTHRMSLLQALLRQQQACRPAELLRLWFRLLRVRDKNLVQLLQNAILGQAKTASNQHSALQSMIEEAVLKQSGIVSEDEAGATLAFRSIQIAIELWRRAIWKDSRTVDLVAMAASSRANLKLMQMSLNFFLGRVSTLGFNEDGEDAVKTKKKNVLEVREKQKEALLSVAVAGMTKSMRRKLKKLSAATRKSYQGEEFEETNSVDRSQAIIQMLSNAQGFAEKLLANLRAANDTAETRLLVLQVLARTIGIHELALPDFYSAIQRYLQPTNKNAVQALACAAQASHSQFNPTDHLLPVLRLIARNFVVEHCQPAAIAAGLNGIRAICARCISAMDRDLLEELIEWCDPKRAKDKGVMMAARSLLGLYREQNPEMLPKRERGKSATEKLLAEKNQESLPLAAMKILSAEELAAIREDGHREVFADTVNANDQMDVIEVEDIASRSKTRADKKARMASIHAGREDRPEFGSRRRGKDRVSMPNAEKAKRSKPQLMLAHKFEVRQKASRSARQKLRVRQAHLKRQKLRK